MCVTGYPEGMADQTTNGSLSNLSNEFSNHRLSSTVRGQHGQHALLSLVPSSLVAPLALTRLAQRWSRNHPNSIRRCFKHGCAGRILHSGRTEGGPLQHYRSDTHRCCMSRHLWGQRKAVGLIHDRRLCCLYNRGPGSPLIMLMLEAGDAQSA